MSRVEVLERSLRVLLVLRIWVSGEGKRGEVRSGYLFIWAIVEVVFERARGREVWRWMGGLEGEVVIFDGVGALLVDTQEFVESMGTIGDFEADG